MSRFTDRIPSFLKNSSKETGKVDKILVIRLIIAAVLLAVAVIVQMPAVVRYVLLALSLIIAGIDLAVNAIESIEAGDYFASSLLVLVTAIIAFCIAFPVEAAALVLVYQLGLLVVDYVDKRSRKASLELLGDQEDEVIARVHERIGQEDATKLRLAGTVEKSASSVLKITMIFAVVCAIGLLFLGDFSIRTSLHRALMILIVCTPFSVVAAMPLTAIYGLCFSAQQGVLFNKAETMEDTAEVSTVVFDKAGIFSQDKPRVLSVQSNILDNRTFMNFAAHAVYYSEQPFAQAISSAYGTEYKLDVISDFQEIPGNGVELQIAGNPVILATPSVFALRGIRIPQDAQTDGQAYYMTVANRYVGRILISDAVNAEARDLPESMVESGVRQCILLTEEGSEESQRLGDLLGFHEVYSECDTEKKLRVLSDLSGEQNKLAYIYANGFEAHSAADVDIRVSKRSKFADALVHPDQISNLPFAVRICKRMCDIAKENAVFAIAVKAILIFLSMIGYSNLWFVMFVDMAAAVATQLHASRITQESLIARIKNR
ncbi:MAG: HAD family hydrolase [Oscillospiraceae bacterium]|nr:HAD family hydrolase [Oscillospiraceae bacterium]